MAIIDPRDPRNAQTKSIQQSLADVSDGLTVFMRDQASAMSEMIATQKEISRSLDASQRLAADKAVLMGGSHGLTPPQAPPPSTHLPSGVPLAEPPQGPPGTPPVPVIQGLSGGTQEIPFNPLPPQGERRGLMDFQLNPNQGNLAGQTRQGIRGGVYSYFANKANQYAGEYQNAPGQFSDPQTGLVYQLKEGARFDPIRGGYFDANGNELSAADAATLAADADPGLHRKIAAASVAANVAKAWGDGAPVGRAVMSVFPAGAIKAAGLAGAAVAVGNQALEWTQGQYAKNQEMRSIYAGGQGEALGMRAEDWLVQNVQGRFSLLGGANYAKLQGSGRQLGLKGGDLRGYVNTGADIMSTGTSANQATALLGMAIEAGAGLGGLADAIRDVNAAAREAGTNAARARDIFQANYEASSDVMFNTSGSLRASAVGAITAAQINQGRQFQGVNPITGTLYDPNQQRAVASSNGMTATQYNIFRSQSPTAAIAMTEQFQLDRLRTMRSATGADIETVVGDFLANLPGGPSSYDPKAHQALLSQALEQAQFDPQVVQAYLRSLGVNASVDESLGVAGQMFTGSSTASTALRDEEERRSSLESKPVSESRVIRGETSFLNSQTGLIGAYAQGLIGGDFIDSEDEVERLYDAQASGVAEELIVNRGSYGISGGSKVRVETKDGARVVTFEEALRYFPDQVAGGTAMFVDGVDDEYRDRSIADVVGLPQDMRSDLSERVPLTVLGRETGLTVPTVPSAFMSSDLGDDYTEWRNDQDDEKRGAGGGVVTFDLTEEARRLLQPIGGDSYYDSGGYQWDGHSTTGGG